MRERERGAKNTAEERKEIRRGRVCDHQRWTEERKRDIKKNVCQEGEPPPAPTGQAFTAGSLYTVNPTAFFLEETSIFIRFGLLPERKACRTPSRGKERAVTQAEKGRRGLEPLGPLTGTTDWDHWDHCLWPLEPLTGLRETVCLVFTHL